MKTCIRLAVLLTLLAGCSQPTSPTLTTGAATPRPPAPPLAPGSFPAVTAPARVYLDATSSPLPSRYILYDDGTFDLQYAAAGQTLDYLGTYQVVDGVLAFHWKDANTAGPWVSTQVLTDETLTVTYGFVMDMDNFVDGVYTRVH